MIAEAFGHTWLEMDLPFPCEIHPCLPQVSVVANAMRVLAIFTEPKKVMIDNAWVRENYRLFHLIATYDRTLADIPNVKIIDFGGVHCNVMPPIKDFSVSFILSTGINAPELEGYGIRRNIAMNFGFSPVPARLFVSSRRLELEEGQLQQIAENAKLKNYMAIQLTDTKTDAFLSMFHIAVENNIDDYYFTEKLLDCFRTYTVPIYWGTSRVLDIFDKDGIIYLEDPARLHEVASSLTPQDYWKRTGAMARNFELAEKYMDPAGRFKRLILASTPWAI
jgi:hypothetical protein